MSWCPSPTRPLNNVSTWGCLMTTATNILKSFDEQSVHIDYLCFTFAVKDLRHCHDAVRRLHKHEEYKGFAKSGLLQRHCRAPKFPAPPVFNPTVAQTSDEIDAYNKAFDICYRNYLEDCLRIFTNQVLGLSLSAPRGLGFQFYTESMKLTSPDGEDFCGFVGIGGNNDTVHFQINGTGCKHVFARRPTWSLHDWLTNVLGVQTLARVDLAYDDYDGIFDCEYAYKAWRDDCFRTAERGRGPVLHEDMTIASIGKDGKPIYTKEQYSIGSRTSRIYWRIYNKALEQKLANTGLVWYRSEVELKKWNVDVLLNPAGAYAALNDFAASISTAKKFNTKDLLASAHWMRRQYGKILNSLIEFHEGDIETVVGSLVRDGTKFTFPDTYGKLVTHILET
ncbi:phage replication protein [Vibrio parahaemolyticus]|nr:replication initiation factor domain-containing protein [Vibrio parahaemolyticus]ELB2826802.1 replication initiation factor domain-containing protein [Vibrio parahaemolyticus]MBM5147412.1 replication initiation factor domain-containing protein [Vibrio parahaemolyticus]MBM5155737.1 replication initiation factor domain-containing protein [Vibrio parahaemolyticus]MBM5161069.1 replication initiation factor domain-containing protein [Vibrio parahaemolyticus]